MIRHRYFIALYAGITLSISFSIILYKNQHIFLRFIDENRVDPSNSDNSSAYCRRNVCSAATAAPVYAIAISNSASGNEMTGICLEMFEVLIQIVALIIERIRMRLSVMIRDGMNRASLRCWGSGVRRRFGERGMQQGD